MMEFEAKIWMKNDLKWYSKSYSVEEFLTGKVAESRKKFLRNTKEYYGLLRRRIINIKETFIELGYDKHP